MTRIILPTIAALAVLVAIARLARELRDVQPDTVRQSAADDSEVVGMPTTWSTDPYTPAERDAIAGRWRWYLELAPTARHPVTSRN